MAFFKKIDILIVRGFIPPFVMTFFIAVFVFNMQFLWKYIDDIVGKGLSVTVIFELLFYQSLAVFPQSFIMAVLIASVMVMGNLAERYELASMKSAGIPLIRIMRPLILVVTVVAMLSVIFSNFVIPLASLEFKSRLYDIRKQKPTLAFKKGQYNSDFQNFTIFIKDKNTKTKELYEVKLFDHSKHRGNSSQTNAKSGKILYSEDKRYMIMRLYEGIRFEDIIDHNSTQNYTFPNMRMMFEEYSHTFDMSEFDFDETDQDLFKKHYSLLRVDQLLTAIDSLDENKHNRLNDLLRNAVRMYHFKRLKPDGSFIDSTSHFIPEIAANFQKIDTVDKFIQLIPKDLRFQAYQKAQSTARTLEDVSKQVDKYIRHNKEIHVKHENAIHIKFTYAIACILFLFIAAPMGAIIRKGGFGWPILVAILFFMVFFVLSVAGEKLAASGSLPPYQGMWLSCLVLVPIGIYLTYQALNDSKLFDISRYIDPIRKLFTKLKKKKN